MMSYQQYFDSTSVNQLDNIRLKILIVFYIDIDEFSSVKKPTSWEHTEQRTGQRVGKTPTNTCKFIQSQGKRIENGEESCVPLG